MRAYALDYGYFCECCHNPAPPTRYAGSIPGRRIARRIQRKAYRARRRQMLRSGAYED